MYEDNTLFKCSSPSENKWILICVKWEDAVWQAEESRIGDICPDGCPCVTAGFLVKETDTHVSIALEYFPADRSWRRIETIPKKMITERHDLPVVGNVT